MVCTSLLVQWLAWMTAALVHGHQSRNITRPNLITLSIAKPVLSSNIKLSGPTNYTPNFKIIYHSCEYPFAECKMLTDLGKNYYPRYLPEVHCKHSDAKIYYGVKVLTKRGESQPDSAIPESLRSCWKFEEIKVPVACDCF